MSKPVAESAFLTSIRGAPVFSRSCLLLCCCHRRRRSRGEWEWEREREREKDRGKEFSDRVDCLFFCCRVSRFRTAACVVAEGGRVTGEGRGRVGSSLALRLHRTRAHLFDQGELGGLAAAHGSGTSGGTGDDRRSRGVQGGGGGG